MGTGINYFCVYGLSTDDLTKNGQFSIGPQSGLIANRTASFGQADFSGWQWPQFEASVLGASMTQGAEDLALGLEQADPRTLWRAAEVFNDVYQVMTLVSETVNDGAAAIAGGKDAPWQGEAATAFLTMMQTFSESIKHNAAVLAQPAGGVGSGAIDLMNQSGNALAQAQVDMLDIDSSAAYSTMEGLYAANEGGQISSEPWYTYTQPDIPINRMVEDWTPKSGNPQLVTATYNFLVGVLDLLNSQTAEYSSQLASVYNVTLPTVAPVGSPPPPSVPPPAVPPPGDNSPGNFKIPPFSYAPPPPLHVPSPPNVGNPNSNVKIPGPANSPKVPNPSSNYQIPHVNGGGNNAGVNVPKFNYPVVPNSPYPSYPSYPGADNPSVNSAKVPAYDIPQYPGLSGIGSEIPAGSVLGDGVKGAADVPLENGLVAAEPGLAASDVPLESGAGSLGEEMPYMPGMGGMGNPLGLTAEPSESSGLLAADGDPFHSLAEDEVGSPLGALAGGLGLDGGMPYLPGMGGGLGGQMPTHTEPSESSGLLAAEEEPWQTEGEDEVGSPSGALAGGLGLDEGVPYLPGLEGLGGQAAAHVDPTEASEVLGAMDDDWESEGADESGSPHGPAESGLERHDSAGVHADVGSTGQILDARDGGHRPTVSGGIGASGAGTATAGSSAQNADEWDAAAAAADSAVFSLSMLLPSERRGGETADSGGEGASKAGAETWGAADEAEGQGYVGARWQRDAVEPERERVPASSLAFTQPPGTVRSEGEASEAAGESDEEHEQFSGDLLVGDAQMWGDPRRRDDVP